MEQGKSRNAIMRFLKLSFVGITVFSIFAFTSLGLYMNRKSREAFHEIGSIYLSGTSEQISRHFESVMQLRFHQVEGLVSVVSPEAVEQEQLYQQLSNQAKVRGFSYLALCATDGTMQTLMGSPIQALNPEPFTQALNQRERRVAIGVDAQGNQVVLFGVDAAYPMPQGDVSTGLVAAMPLNYITDLLALDQPEQMLIFCIVRSDGSFVIRNDRMGLGDTSQRLPELLNPYPHTADEAYCQEDFDEALRKHEPYAATILVAGDEQKLFSVPLSSSEWNLISIMPNNQLNDVLDTLNVQRTKFTIISCLSVLVLMLLVFIRYFYMSNAQIAALEQSRRETAAASKAKSEFLANMSHDIRTPMNGIIGFLRLLKEQQDQPERREEYIRKMEDSSQMLLSILNNVLEMARIEGGAGALEETAWSVEALTEDVCGLLAPKMAEKHIVFTHAAAVRHPAVWCDRAKVQEVFLNILNNACQYTPEGGTVSVRVTELPAEEDGAALYKTEITDSGIGMDETFLPHLFEAFARAQDTTHSKVSGTGLGMTIAKRLTDLMGGTIAVESAAGRGTRVTVVLPHRIAGEADLTDKPAWDAGTADLAGKRILLAEDNDLNAEIAAELLGELGLLVERARDGDECVAMLEREEQAHYDLILMDVQMPRMSGYEAAAAIRKLGDPAKASIPIVAMTANAFAEDKQNAGAAGMDGHLAKPVDMEKLLERLREFL